MKRLLSTVFSFVILAFATCPLFAVDKVVDWDGRLEGEPQTPSWIRTLRRGNGTMYCQEYGLYEKINRKWLVPCSAESYVGWEDGLIAAQANVLSSLSESIATDVISEIGSKLNNGKKSNFKAALIKSINRINGAEYEGSYWYQVEKEVPVGNGKTSKMNVWYVYAFYSIDSNMYDTQLKIALQTTLKKSDLGFTKDELNIIATAGLAALDDRNRASAEHDKAVAEEQQRLLTNHRLSLENRSMTMAETAQNNQYNLTQTAQSQRYNLSETSMANQNQLSNRNVDTNQLMVTEHSNQIQSTNTANTQISQANANSAAQVSSASNLSKATGTSSSSGASGDGGMTDAMAFLMSL